MDTECADSVFKGIERFGYVLGAVGGAHEPGFAWVVVYHNATFDQAPQAMQSKARSRWRNSCDSRSGSRRDLPRG